MHTANQWRQTSLVIPLLFTFAFPFTFLLADTITIPSSTAYSTGNNQTNTPIRDSGNPRTLQLIVGRQHLANVPIGSLITGLGLRLKADGLGAWPAATMTWPSYSVTIASAALQSTNFSTTLANNTLADPVVAFAGPLVLPAGSLPGGALATAYNAFGTFVTFTQPFKYQGQDLVITLRHTGSDTAGLTRFLDGINNSHASYGLGGLAALSATSATATTAAGAPFPIIELRYAPPSTALPMTVPATRTGIPGNAISTSLLGRDPVTYQLVINADMLGRIPSGSTIEALALRLAPSKSSFPAVGTVLNYPTFDITMGQSAFDAGAATPAFNTNFAAGDSFAAVRSGPLTIGPAALRSSLPALQQPASLRIDFTAPYVYTTGGLTLQIRQTGSGVAVNPELDALPITTSAMSARQVADLTTTTGTPAAPIIADLLVAPALCVPATNITQLGNSGSQEFFAAGATTFQVLLAGESLGQIPIGSLIDGISLRSVGAAAWPSKSVLASRFDILLSGTRLRPQAMSTAISANADSTQTLVRQGPLPVSIGAYAVAGSISRRWGPTIKFDRPFIYAGGDLLLVVRHSGFGADVGSLRTDGAAPTNSTGFAGAKLGADATETSISASLPIIRLHYTVGSARPAAFAQSVGDTEDSTLMSPSPSAYQFILSAASLPIAAKPTPITGLNFRLAPNTPSGPTLDARFARFDISIAVANARAGEHSSTFANNHASSETIVRTGDLVVPAWTGRSNAAGIADSSPPSIMVRFDRPYLWNGEDLAITIRSSGWSLNQSLALDAADPGLPGVLGFAAVNVASDADASIGAGASIPIVNLASARPIWWRVGDIADDRGIAPPAGTAPNTGVNEGDYNAFFAGFFSALPTSDIADDQGNSLPSELPNTGVNEGDYNQFFRIFFL